MSGIHAKLNKEKFEIESNIINNGLNKLRVIVTYDPKTKNLTPKTQNSIFNRIKACNDLIERCSISIGMLKNINLDSGELVQSHDKWRNKQTEFENMLRELKDIRDSELELLQNFDDQLINK